MCDYFLMDVSDTDLLERGRVFTQMEKMIAFSEGNIHDITHFSCVWTYAKTIGKLEGLDTDTQFVLEVAAITHDIACPLCRKKYGNTNGKYQEQEGAPMVREFLADTGITAAQIDHNSQLPAAEFQQNITAAPLRSVPRL